MLWSTDEGFRLPVKSIIAGNQSWLSDAEHVQISFRSMKPVPTSNTFTGVLYGLLAAAHTYYNNTLFVLFLTMLYIELFSLQQY